MTSESPRIEDLAFHPATPDRWADLQELFGERGACAGCWCMWWRMKRSEWSAGRGDSNRAALKAIVDSGQVPGILAYVAGHAVGWCAIAPRTAFPALERSRTLKPVDDQPAWAVVCFFVDRSFRRQGLSVQLLRAAVEYARSQGAQLVEGYPNVARRSAPDPWVFMGLASAFRQAGFTEVARPSASRAIMRRVT